MNFKADLSGFCLLLSHSKQACCLLAFGGNINRVLCSVSHQSKGNLNWFQLKYFTISSPYPASGCAHFVD
jgi:hypothetical protein